MTDALLLALDQGTTSTRTIAFDAALVPRATAQEELPQHFPAPGWVEHEPEDIWRGVVATLRGALERAGGDASRVAGIGITNQRETTLLWDRATGRCLHRAIVWQDRRTAEHCARLRAEGLEALITERTGLLADPYFSATKLAWLLDRVPGAREAAERGELAFGTVDCFVLWRLTGGRVHATDATNAARTMLFDIRRGDWDEDLLRLLRIPRAVLPSVHDCASDFGLTEAAILGAPVPVRGMAGDQQAATLGQACFSPGMVKSTYGTGCFALLNTGAEPVASRSRLLTTIAYQLGGRRTYALEGAIFVAGAAVQWLRDGLGIIGRASEAGELAAQADPAQRVIMVPAFTGLGAPHWDAEARAAIFGMTRGTGRAELCRAALESVAFQTRDLVEAMRADWPGAAGETVLRVDGGMTASDWTMQALADVLGAAVDRPQVQETTALGAAYLAGLQAGLLPEPGVAGASHWRLERRFLPGAGSAEAELRYGHWRNAVRRTLGPMDA
ncbi:glycerol kinase GlpK [Neoroseomonas oryzicola]|uniref:Glycerol kinase n=1 Tax=Neoroseomonas oryzicola TaxID=535904 RepID=A0A9X9WKR1_9PROT|nr:glycerol kinase GlpK [Neoroseomonas oryzicola]MBR0660921.1 glycerol kinase GlpK [Neoroseomonas oryzicola]NKE19324.1 glycerol kinase GlpK [Neoroseomonas oryzicola]